MSEEELKKVEDAQKELIKTLTEALRPEIKRLSDTIKTISND